MPNFDGTGPAGQGPKTGGQMGNCDGAKKTNRPLDGRGRGMGGRGRGRGQGLGQGRGLGNVARRWFGGNKNDD